MQDDREVSKSYLGYYILAGMVGVAIGMLILGLIAGVKFAISIVLKYWWVLVIGVFALLFARKFFRRKKKSEPE